MCFFQVLCPADHVGDCVYEYTGFGSAQVALPGLTTFLYAPNDTVNGDLECVSGNPIDASCQVLPATFSVEPAHQVGLGCRIDPSFAPLVPGLIVSGAVSCQATLLN